MKYAVAGIVFVQSIVKAKSGVPELFSISVTPALKLLKTALNAKLFSN